jgi:hypothetical protein
MLYFAVFFAGITLGVFSALYFLAPEQKEESWDPQNFPVLSNKKIGRQSPNKVIQPVVYIKKHKLAKV